MSLKRKNSPNCEYLQPSTTNHSDDSSQSPLELLAQTCSSIGKESPIPSRKSLSMRKPSSNPDKSVSQANSRPTNVQTIDYSLNPPMISPSTYIEPYFFSPMYPPPPPPFDLRSSSCTNPICFHCENLRRMFSPIDYERSYPRMIKLSNNRFHPYLKSSNQLPFFYPHLSLLSTSKATRRLNNNPREQ